MRRALVTSFVFLLLIFQPTRASGCSYSCISGRTLQPGSSIIVRHLGQPLPGVSVMIRAEDSDSNFNRFKGTTDHDGKVELPRVDPGRYWISVEFMGIRVSSECIRIMEHFSPFAESRLEFDWAPDPVMVSRVEGKLVDARPPEGEPPPNFLARIKNREQLRAGAVLLPITYANLRLQSVASRETYFAASDAKGTFSFEDIPDGSYVLRIEGGISFNEYDPTEFVVRVDSSTDRRDLHLKTLYPDFGFCGYKGLMLDSTSSEIH